LNPHIFEVCREAIVIQLTENYIWPTEFIGIFLEHDGVSMEVTIVRHFECKEFIRCASDAVGVTENGFELEGKLSPIIDLRIRGSSFDIATEMMLSHTLEVVNGIDDAGFFGLESAGFDIKNETALEEEFSKLSGVITTEGSQSLSIALFGMQNRGRWRCHGSLNNGLKRWEQTHDESLITSPHRGVNASGSRRHNSGSGILRDLMQGRMSDER